MPFTLEQEISENNFKWSFLCCRARGRKHYIVVISSFWNNLFLFYSFKERWGVAVGGFFWCFTTTFLEEPFYTPHPLTLLKVRLGFWWQIYLGWEYRCGFSIFSNLKKKKNFCRCGFKTQAIFLAAIRLFSALTIYSVFGVLCVVRGIWYRRRRRRGRRCRWTGREPRWGSDCQWSRGRFGVGWQPLYETCEEKSSFSYYRLYLKTELSLNFHCKSTLFT